MKLDLPVGWLQLAKEKQRLAVAVAGTAFAVVLVFMQLGLQESMFDSAVRVHQHWVHDIVLLHPETAYIVRPKPISRRRLFQTLAVDGVATVAPVYFQQAQWKDPRTGGSRAISVMAFDPADDAVELDAVRAQISRLKLRDHYLFDRGSRAEYGPVAERVEREGRAAAEINNRSIEVVGVYELGTSFGIDGSLITSDVNFARIFPQRPPGLIDFGLIRVEPGHAVARVRDEIRALLPRDVLVLSRAEFIAREKAYWRSSTPIGAVLGFGVVVGLAVGGIVVYQILFADVLEHLAEYATLKAMGYSQAGLAAIVLQQAVALAVLGFAVGLLVALQLYAAYSRATLLPLEMTALRSAIVFALTLAMCTSSALLALRKLRRVDPADVF